MKYLFFLLSSILLLTSCQKDDSEGNTPPAPAKRTVLVFMSAENNLTGYTDSDIKEMIQGRKLVGDDCDLLFYCDHASKTEKPFIARIRNNTSQPIDTLYHYPADFYSTESSHFMEILQRMTQLSPAKEYALVFWGHANGWILENDGVNTIRRAYGVDNGDNDSSSRVKEPARWLNIPDMAKCFKQLGIHWKFIFFDCCNMQSVEVAYELRNATDYIIASPAEITGSGAPYDTMVPDFFIEDGEQMGIKMCEDYNAQFDYVGGHLPISVIATNKMQALADATRQVLPEIANWLKTENPTKGIIYYYNYDSAHNKGYFPEFGKVMYDMNDMIRAALANEPEKYEKWEKAFFEAVFYAETSTKWHANTIQFSDFEVTEEKFGGMSMFFPLSKYEQSEHKYNEEIMKMQWYQAVGW